MITFENRFTPFFFFVEFYHEGKKKVYGESNNLEAEIACDNLFNQYGFIDTNINSFHVSLIYFLLKRVIDF